MISSDYLNFSIIFPLLKIGKISLHSTTALKSANKNSITLTGHTNKTN